MTLGSHLFPRSYDEKSVKSEDRILPRKLQVYLGRSKDYSLRVSYHSKVLDLGRPLED